MEIERPKRTLKPYLPLRNQERGIVRGPALMADLTSNITTLSSRIRTLNDKKSSSLSESPELTKYSSTTLGDRSFSEIKDVYRLIQKQCELLANRYNQNHFTSRKQFDGRLNTLKSNIDAALVIFDVPEREKYAHQLMFWYSNIRFEPINLETLSESLEELTTRFKRCFDAPTFYDAVRNASINHSEIDPARIHYVGIHIRTMEQIFLELFELISPVGSRLVFRDLGDDAYKDLFKGFNLILGMEMMFNSIKPSRGGDGKIIKVYTNGQKRLFKNTMDFISRNRSKDDFKVSVGESPYSVEELGIA